MTWSRPLSCLTLVLVTAWSIGLLGLTSAADQDSKEETAGPFEWFKTAEPADSAAGRAASPVANTLAIVTTLQAADSVTGHGLFKTLLSEGLQSTRRLAEQLRSTLGPDVASFQPTDHGQGQVHLNLGHLLTLPDEQLNARLAAAVNELGLTPPTTAPADSDSDQNTSQTNTLDGQDDSVTPDISTLFGHDNAFTDSNSSVDGRFGPDADALNSTQDGVNNTNHDLTNVILNMATRSLLQASGGAASATRLINNRTLSIVSTTGKFLAAVKQARQDNTIKRVNKTSWWADLGVDWQALQDKVQTAARRAYDADLLNKPRIRGFERLKQLFQIFTDRVTAGQGLGQGCTPYTFNGGGARLPETFIFPSFSISKTTGNCVLIPEFIGNAEYPGQWSLVNQRIACLGPASEYLQVPAFWRAAATSSETFACPTCRNEFSIGPAVTITLVGDQRATVTYRNKAEFLAALKTNKTFGWGAGGMNAAIAAFQSRLQEKKEVMNKYLGTRDGSIGALGTWITNTWSKWLSSTQASVDTRALRRVLEMQEQGMDPSHLNGWDSDGSNTASSMDSGTGDPEQLEGGDVNDGGWQNVLLDLLEKAKNDKD